MKKIMLLTIVIASFLVVGCSDTNHKIEDEQDDNVPTTKIVWQVEANMSSPYDYESYFNSLLIEKGYPYQVDFVTKATKGEQVVDLLNVGITTWKDTYNVITEIDEGKIIPLDEYFATEHGQKLWDSIPEKLWKAYQVNGKQYTILSAGYAPFRTAYIWDKEMAEKYDIHPEEWTAHIWEYEDELLKIKNEKGIMPINGIVTQYLKDAIGLTKVLGFYYPIVIDEESAEVRAEFLYETEEYKEALQGITKLYESGVYQPEVEDNEIIGTFMEVDVVFMNEDAYQQWQQEGFWDTHGAKVVDEDALWKLGCTAYETGITAECANPEEVFQFMCALYTDPDLTNAIMWGEEGVNFEVDNNVAVERNSNGGYKVVNPMGNPFISYVEKGQDPNRTKTYSEMIENATVSKINGFDFRGEGCKEELEKVFTVSSEIGKMEETIYIKQPELIIQKYKDAGIDKVIEEWNREFQEWKIQQ